MEDTNMEIGLSMKDIGTYTAAACAMFIEEIIRHPIGTMVSIVGLLYAYERWRTQKIIRRIKTKELENEGSNRNTKERTEGS